MAVLCIRNTAALATSSPRQEISSVAVDRGIEGFVHQNYVVILVFQINTGWYRVTGRDAPLFSLFRWNLMV